MVRLKDSLLWSWLGLFVGLKCVDAVTTVMLLPRVNIVEGNPIMVAVIARIGLIQAAILSILCTAVLGFIIIKVLKYCPRLVTILEISFLTGIMVVAVINNLIIGFRQF